MDDEFSLGRRKSPLGLVRNRPSIRGTIGCQRKERTQLRHKPKVQCQRQQRVAQISQRSEGLTRQQQTWSSDEQQKRSRCFSLHFEQVPSRSAEFMNALLESSDELRSRAST